MTRIDEELNESLFKNDSSTSYNCPVKEVYEDGKRTRIYYNSGLEIDLENKKIELYGTLKLETIKILIEKFKEARWI